MRINNNYDKQLIDSIKNKIGISKTIEIGEYLTVNEVDLNIFISAFWGSLSYYTTMYKELLNMFEQASAQYSDENIRIEYDLINNERLSFDLSVFRREYRKTVEISKRIMVLHYDPSILWSISHNDFSSNKDIYPPSVNQWIKEYHSDEWFRNQLERPIFKDNIIDDKLFKAWKIFESHTRHLKGYYKNYMELKTDVTNKSDGVGFWSETDQVSRIFIEAIFSYYHEFISGTDDQKSSVLDTLNRDLRKVDDYYVVVEKEIAKLIDELAYFLVLPIWQKRHELYSVWTSVPFINSFESEDVSFNIVDGALSFAFGGSKVATINYNGHQLQFRAELRTKCTHKLKGNSRISSIQPDYSLTKENFRDPNETLIVLECKQYLKPKYTNFSGALEDYALGRPNAKIILTDYGNFNESTLIKKINPSVVDRTKAIPNFKPGSKYIDSFQKSIRDYLSSVLKFDQLEDQMLISLEWGELPSDLDLWLYVENQEDNYKCGFSNVGGINLIPFCEYIGDVTNGYGPEFIRISSLLPYNYKIIVHNYSKDGALKNSNAIVKVSSGNLSFIFEVPRTLDIDYWYVAEINGKSKQLCLKNKPSRYENL